MSRFLLGSLLVAFAWASPAPAQQPRPTHRIEATEQQTVTATITYEIRTTAFAATRWIAFLPEPPELPSQRNVKTRAEPAGKVVPERSTLARKVRVIDVPVARPAAGTGLSLKLDVRATLMSRKLVPLAKGEKPPTVAPLTATERKYYLAPTPLVDFDAKPFRAWLDAKKLRRGKAETPLRFATRMLEVLRADFEYRYDPGEDKRASAVCGRGATDCGGLTLMFVGAMRANNIPARLLIGRIAKPRKPGSGPADLEYDRPHVRAELYVTGIGWVPVDPTYANADKRQPVTAFVGDDPGDLLVLHVDVDLRLPLQNGEQAATLLQISPSYWATGRGPFDATLGPTGWELKTTLAREP